MSYNVAMIQGYGKSKYGLDLSDQDAQNIMNNSGGGDPGRLDSAFSSLPQVQTNQAFDTAKKAQQMQVEANQPAIQTLNTHKTDLDSKYQDLLTSINSSEHVAGDAAQLSANNELARRGIGNDSGLYEREMAGAIAPVSAQFGQLKANTGLSREQDLTGIAQQIAQLQAGNVPNALNFSNSVMGLQQQAQQIANQLELGRDSNSIARMTAQNNSAGTQNRYTTLSEGQTLYDILNNNPIYTAAKTYKNGVVADNSNHGGV
jgi:hypothetical protein